MENWIGLWYKHFNADPTMAFRDLYYAGYCGQMKDAIVPIHSRPRDVNGVPSFRKSFNVQVVGPNNCGKTTFLRKFLELPDDSVTAPSNAIKCLKEKDAKKRETLKYL